LFLSLTISFALPALAVQIGNWVGLRDVELALDVLDNKHIKSKLQITQHPHGALTNGKLAIAREAFHGLSFRVCEVRQDSLAFIGIGREHHAAVNEQWLAFRKSPDGYEVK